MAEIHGKLSFATDVLKVSLHMKKRLVVIVALPDCLSLDVVGPAEVLSTANHLTAAKGTPPGDPPYEIVFASGTADRSITLSNGLPLHFSTSVFDIDRTIDTLIIGGFSRDHRWKKYPELIQWIKFNAGNIRRVCSVCVGAFALAEAGLLNGKKATTHWKSSQSLNTNYENIKVDSSCIYVKDANIYTSAGASAGIDLALALLEEDHGRELALSVAQMLVLFLKRPGNQSQFNNFLGQQYCNKEPIRELQGWILENFKKDLPVAILAERVSMSPRNFARVFLAETGLTPAKYIEKLRVEASKRLLEETNLSLEKIAKECGLGNSDTMRKIYLRNIQLTPANYRDFFGVLQ
jgi:transcriptional regulator GlxA family with amidase domain